LPGDLLHRRGLLEGVHRADERVEHIEQNEGDVLVEMKPAVAGGIALAADLVQGSKQGEQMPEAFDAADLPRVRRLG